jgi:hypothetical protein
MQRKYIKPYKPGHKIKIKQMFIDMTHQAI